MARVAPNGADCFQGQTRADKPVLKGLVASGELGHSSFASAAPVEHLKTNEVGTKRDIAKEVGASMTSTHQLRGVIEIAIGADGSCKLTFQ